MYDRLVIIGAGGHGKAVADLALRCGYRESAISFVDDHATGDCMGFPIVATCRDLAALRNEHTAFVIAIGDGHIRKKIAESYDLPWATLIHPSATVGYHADIGVGTVVLAGAVIGADAIVGAHGIINTGSIVEHENRIGDYVHISPRAVLGGGVVVGEGTQIGIGAVVKDHVHLCAHCLLGAGSVAVKDITESGVYIGVPAKWHRGVVR